MQMRQTLLDCQADEVSHRDEAAALGSQSKNPLLRLWCAVVGAGHLPGIQRDLETMWRDAGDDAAGEYVRVNPPPP